MNHPENIRKFRIVYDCVYIRYILYMSVYVHMYIGTTEIRQVFKWP